jgi:hypothetical protein
MAEKSEQSLEMRVAELEDKLAKLSFTEEELAAYNKVASAMAGGMTAAAAPAQQQGPVGPCQIVNCFPPPPPCVVSQCLPPPPCVIQPCRINPCTIVNPCTIRPTIVQCIPCINECGGGLPGTIPGGGFGTLGG